MGTTTIALEKLHEIGDWMLGTCNTLDAAIERFDLNLEVDDLEDQLLNVNVEQCVRCYWWFESGELVDEGDTFGEGRLGYCADCE